MVIGLSVLLGACQARDVQLDNVKQQLDQGQVLKVTENGKRLPTCQASSDDWTDVYVPPQNFYVTVLQGTGVYINHGSYNCLRVGSTVSVFHWGDNDQKIIDGRIVITGLVLSRIDQLQAKDVFSILGKGSNIDNTFENALDQTRQRMKPSDQGVVNVVIGRYVKGSSPIEKDIDDAKVVEAKPGQTLSDCKSIWNDVSAGPDAQAVFDGKMQTVVGFGDYSCVKQGATVALKASLKTPSLGSVKVESVRSVPLRLLTEDMIADILTFKNQTLDQFVTETRSHLDARDRDTITLTKVTPVSGGSTPLPAPLPFDDEMVTAPGQMLSKCDTSLGPNQYVEIPGYDLAKIRGGQQTVLLSPDLECVQVGQTILLTGQDGVTKKVYGSVKVRSLSLLHFTSLNDDVARKAYAGTAEDLRSLLTKLYGTSAAVSPWTVVEFDSYKDYQP